MILKSGAYHFLEGEVNGLQALLLRPRFMTGHLLVLLNPVVDVFVVFAAEGRRVHGATGRTTTEGAVRLRASSSSCSSWASPSEGKFLGLALGAAAGSGFGFVDRGKCLGT